MPTKIISIAALFLLCIQASAKKDAETAQTSLSILTDPKAAMVFFDGERKSATPLRLRNPKPGEHLIVIKKKGFRDVRRTIIVTAGQRLVEEFKLAPLTGLMVIHSTPSGAAIKIDGADKGNSPKLLTDVPLGQHRLQVTSPGHVPKTIDIVIENRRPKRIDVDLTSDSATVVLDSEPSGAVVTLNGVAKGTTPVTLSPIPAGESTIELTMAGGVSADVHAETSGGKIVVDLDAAEFSKRDVDEVHLTVGSGDARVELGSGNGDIHIRG